MPLAKFLCISTLCLGLAACFNDNHEREVHLGDATVGQQLMDLKTAREAGAISEAEYRKARRALVHLLTELACDDDECAKAKNSSDLDHDDKPLEPEEEEEGFSWL